MDNYLKAALSVEQLKVSYVQNKKRLPVLDGISCVLEKGKILALLGESGSGKSTCGKSLIGVLPPSAKIDSGTVRFGNGDYVDISDNDINWKTIPEPFPRNLSVYSSLMPPGIQDNYVPLLFHPWSLKAPGFWRIWVP